MKRLQPIFDKLDKRTPRERLFLLVAGLAVLFLLWDTLLVEPFLTQKRILAAQAMQTRERIDGLRQQIDQIIARHNRDPDQENRRRLAQLREENSRLDQRLEAVADAFIPPRVMTLALEELLAKHEGLKLLEMTNLPPEPILEPGPKGTALPPDSAQLMVYRHPLVLRYEGAFGETLKFVRQVEDLQHLLFWQKLDIQVQEHPRARITIIVFTLSLQKGWIGA